MSIETKRVSARVEVKDADKGEVEAVFATLDVKDLDWDVTRDGAFEDGASVVISAYGHKSWMGVPPVGKGTIAVVGKDAILKGQFFMNTTSGRETFEVVKSLAESDMGEWSYGFDPVEYSFGEFEGERVRFLDKLKVHEVSPVMLGAGLDTRTLNTKSLKDELAEAVAAVDAAIQSADRVVALRAEHGEKLSKVNVDSVDALFDRLSELKAKLTVKDDKPAGMTDVEKEWLRMLASDLEI